jgi:Na+/proline symporter
MVLGIVSLVLWCFWYLSIPCAILAIIFGIIGKKRAGKGMAIAGLVLGIITLVILGILLLVGASTLSSLNSVNWNTVNY